MPRLPYVLSLCEFGYSGRGDHGRFLLALSESLRLLTVYVYTREFLAVEVVDRGQPVVMLAAAVCLKDGASLPGRHFS